MSTVLIAAGAFVGYVLAYHTYGKFLARRIFQIDDSRPTPARTMSDGVDYVPTKAEVLFGHHFTSIAGTGPIVGPAIAIIWGWVPALVWVLLGSIFMGAVHDFSAIVISTRHGGRSIGDVARDIVNGRVRTLFLMIIFLVLLIVIAIFCLVIAVLFNLYPQSVFPVWVEIPIALVLGHAMYRRGVHPLAASLVAVAGLYVAIVIGAYMPLKMPSLFGQPPVIVWTVLLLVYAYVASVLPVWRLLQPRDYINGHELFIALGLLGLGVVFARPEIVAPAVDFKPSGAPPMWPMLFVTVACGAISGFHCLVGSGTTSKQLSQERHALAIGYGGMLTEGMLAVFVIIAVAAGIGMAVGGESGGVAAWQARYASWAGASGLDKKVGAFVDGSANMLTALRIPRDIALALMGVFVASFAATTLDTATRLQRYVVSELATGLKLKPLAGRHAATLIAVVTAGLLAFPKGGKGGLILWPLFGGTNQLLACLALLVTTVYLKRRGRPLGYTAIPMVLMLVMTSWAMVYNVRTFAQDPQANWHLIVIGVAILALEAWMVIESLIVLGVAKADLAEGEPVPVEVRAG